MSLCMCVLLVQLLMKARGSIIPWSQVIGSCETLTPVLETELKFPIREGSSFKCWYFFQPQNPWVKATLS